MDKPHWFPFFPNKFLSSTKIAIMTTEEIGAYTLLLSHEWNDPACALPNDDNILRRLGRIEGDLTNIKACFIVKHGKLINQVLYDEWNKTNEIRSLRAEAGKKGGQANALANALAKEKPGSSILQSQSQSQSQSQKQSQTPKQKKRINSAGDLKVTPAESKGKQTWEAYADAYKRRYGVDPVRNQSVNAMMCTLVRLLGAEIAPHVAAYFVSHNDMLYVRSRHAPNLLLRDASGLHTQWASGVKATPSEARSAVQQDDAREQIKRVEAMLSQKVGSA